MKKKKKKPRSPQNITLKRNVRLLRAKAWVAEYQGDHIVKAYRKRYHTDWISAIVELRLLGVPVSDAYEKAIRSHLEQSAKQKKAKEEAAKKKQEEFMGQFSDDTFSFIVGYTSGGAPYGVPWPERSENDVELESDD